MFRRIVARVPVAGFPSTVRELGTKSRRRRGARQQGPAVSGKYAAAAAAEAEGKTAPGRVLMRSRVGTPAEQLVAVLLGVLTGVYIFDDSFRVLGRGGASGGGIDPSDVGDGEGALIRTGPHRREE